eukprot:2239471-Pleurochrysis_carterae.AAC.1
MATSQACDSYPFGYVQIRLSGYSGTIIRPKERNSGLAQFLRHSSTFLVHIMFGVNNAELPT